MSRARSARAPRASSVVGGSIADPVLAQVPVLDPVRIGHIRHIENLANQLDNEWAHMGIRDAYQEGFESLRYQLAYMAFALGLAHFHRLPSAPGYFRDTFRRLVEKMLLPAVWYYWRDTSRGGGAANWDAPRSDGWIDPVVRDNIMFSAYVQSMSVMYNFLFDDDRFAQPGALSFEFHPTLFGWDTRKEFVYDQDSLNEHLYWRMVESGYLGIACEPYCVFQICNQPAILAFRLHDVLKGTSRAKEVTDGWLAAWSQFGHLDSNQHFNTHVLTHRNEVQPNRFGPWADGWLGTLLHMWNPELVEEHYERIVGEWVVDYDDGTSFVPSLATEGADDLSAGSALDFGWIAAWSSEMGDSLRLDRFLRYADTTLDPTWENGGYFYPRNDTQRNSAGRIITVSPCLGNALLPYARLNVPSGLWGMYNQPWGPEHFDEPLIDEVSDNIDITQATYLPEHNTLLFGVSKRKDRAGDAAVTIEKVWAPGRRRWTLTRGGSVCAWGDADSATGDGLLARKTGDALELVFESDCEDRFLLAWE